MIKQIASTGCSATYFDGFDKSRVVCKHSIDSFLDELGGFLAHARGGLLKSSFFVRGKTNFHDAVPSIARSYS